ncbi:MAG: signal recognition particle protein, partial [Ruminococcus sp.]
LLVIDSMTGQDAVNVAKSFNDLLDITGVILTKLDGDTRGGAALSVKAVTGKPIKFSGTGEKLSDIEVFHPDRMASRILGMGDVLTLIEEAESKLDQKKAEELANKMLQNKMDFNDLLAQFDQIQKLGPLKGILSKIPGMNQKQLDEANIDERQIDWCRAIILSMTEAERANPALMNPSRKRRIAAGSGRSVEEVNRIIKQLEQMQKLMKQMNSKGKKGGKKRRNLPGLGGMMPPGGMDGFGGF